MINQLYQIQKRKMEYCISYSKYFEINVYIISIVTKSIDVNLNEKG